MLARASARVVARRARAQWGRWPSLVGAHSTASLSRGDDNKRKRNLEDVPSLKEFMHKNPPSPSAGDPSSPSSKVQAADEYVEPASLISAATSAPSGGTVYLETYGCQMNESDSEIVHAVLAASGYTRTESMEAADVILTNTCAIREGAEQKVWNRLAVFAALKRGQQASGGKPVVIGVLGCMAERLKTKLLEADRLVDIVAGPDAYRDLPRLIALVRAGAAEHAVNVQLSGDETYADIAPVRGDAAGGRVSAFVSIMRGCSNMCSFCVVPFTRGRERSRDAGTIVDEVRRLADEGYREVTLLGQNVNSYWDAGSPSEGPFAGAGYKTAAGFTNMYRLRHGPGVRFSELLARVSDAAPGVRIRFTSPHPKDFPGDLLGLIAERPNVAKQVHLPAQSGSTRVLAAMRRGYTREAYLDLAATVRSTIPGVALSTDIIAGFCGETMDDHADTLSLMAGVQYENAYMFAYSKRDRTHAAYKLVDDVPGDVKAARLQQVIATFRAGARAALARDVGRTHLVLVEGPARKSTPELPLLSGRTDCNKRCVMAATGPVAPSLAALGSGRQEKGVDLRRGDFVVVTVTGIGETSLLATPLAVSSIAEYAAWVGAGRGTAGTSATVEPPPLLRV